MKFNLVIIFLFTNTFIDIDLKEIGWDGMDWNHLAQDWDRWWALVNTVMNFRFHKEGDFLEYMNELAFQELCSMKFIS
jgi:hypothetical protein